MNRKVRLRRSIKYRKHIFQRRKVRKNSKVTIYLIKQYNIFKLRIAH